MSVNVGQRHTPDTASNRALDACVKARELAAHTIKICSNENIFLPKYQTALTNKVIDLATDIFSNAYGANCIKVDGNPERWKII